MPSMKRRFLKISPRPGLSIFRPRASKTNMGRFFAAFAGVDKAEYYEIPEGQKEAPKVKL